MCHIANGFRDRAVSLCSSSDLAPNIIIPSGMSIDMKRQLAVVTADNDNVGVLWKMPHFIRNAEYADMLYAALTRVAKCINLDGVILEKVLYLVNWTNFITWTMNTGIRNGT
jgi:hypothetical protein